MEGIKQVCLV